MDERDLEAGRAVDGRLFTAAQRSWLRQMLLGMVAVCVAFVAAGSWPTWLGVTFVAVWLLYMLRLSFILLRDSLDVASSLKRRDRMPSSAPRHLAVEVSPSRPATRHGAVGGWRNRVFRFAPLATVVTYFVVTYQLAARGVDRDLIKLVSLVLVALSCLAIVLYAVRLNSKINREASTHNRKGIESPPGT